MLALNELNKILKDNNINSEEFSFENINSIYGIKIDEKLLLPLVQEMVLAVVDFDTPLYDVLAYANELEDKLKITEDYSNVCEILNIVINNLPVCKENADRLFDLLEEADILDAYNILMQDYKEYLTEKQITLLTEMAKTTFDNGILL